MRNGYLYEMNSLVEENYLKALFSLANEKDEVTVNELSQRLRIKMPTVTNMMKKLAAKELVSYEKYKPVSLTEKGQVEARQIIRKHRLTEMFLVEVMGFGWEEVHAIAEQVEHVNSDVFFRKMDELLNFPAFDPHGSPIPDEQGRIKREAYVPLSDCEPGDQVRVMAVANSSEDFLIFLNKKGIRLGLEITVEAKEAFDHTVVVNYAGHVSEHLSQMASEWLLVQVS